MRWWLLGVLGVLSAGVRADDVLVKPVQRAPWVRARVPSLPGNVPELAVSKVVLTHVKSYALLILPPTNKGVPWPQEMRYWLYLNDEKNTTGTLTTQKQDFSSVLLHTLLLPEAASAGSARFKIRFADQTAQATAYCLPSWLSVIPLILTPILCVFARHPVIGLMVATWVSSSLVHGDPAVGFLRTCDTYLASTIQSSSHLRIVVFLVLVHGVMAISQKAGGILGLGIVLKKSATTRRRAQIATMVMTSLTAVDDRFSIVVVGQTLAGVAGSVGVTPERFACIVHTAAVCIASLVPISTLGALQLGFVTNQYSLLDITTNPFIGLLKTLMYRFFPVLVAASVLIMLALSRNTRSRGRKPLTRSDSMESILEEEPREVEDAAAVCLTYNTGVLLPDAKTTPRCITYLLPLAGLVIGAPLGMYLAGLGEIAVYNQTIPSFQIEQQYSNVTALNAMTWAALGALVGAMFLAVGQRLLTVEQAVHAWFQGVQNGVPPLVTVFVVWALGVATGDLHLADYLSHVLGDMPKDCLPPILFVLSGVLSYVCGSGIAAMGILFPAAIPFANQLGGQSEDFVVQSMAAILSGSVFGEISSPLSESTVLATVSTDCKVSFHTSAQVQFMSVLAFLSFCSTTLPVSFGWLTWYEAYPIGLLVLLAMVGITGCASADSESLFWIWNGNMKAPLLDIFSSRQRAAVRSLPQDSYASDSDEGPVSAASILTSGGSGNDIQIRP